jgi:hypothetical protein
MNNDNSPKKLIVLSPGDESFSRRSWYVSELDSVDSEPLEKYVMGLGTNFSFELKNINASTSIGPPDPYISHKEKLTSEEKNIIRSERNIFADLNILKYESYQFSLFGSSEPISHFSLHIRQCKNIDNLQMRAYACGKTLIDFELVLHTEMFDSIFKNVSDNCLNGASIHFGSIDGLYECDDYSMMSDVDQFFKILTASEEQQPVIFNKIASFAPPRLGVINDFQIHLHSRRTFDNQ